MNSKDKTCEHSTYLTDMWNTVQIKTYVKIETYASNVHTIIFHTFQDCL